MFIEVEAGVEFRLNPVQSRGIRKNIMITPELSEDSQSRDLELCQRLISEVLDPEKNIEPSVFQRIEEYATRELDERQHLDLLLLYMRRIHAYCFYCGEEFEDER